jgi:hypothetical protein
MKQCIGTRQIQDYLDQSLAGETVEELERHIEVCKRCSAELALYRRLFDSLDRLPLENPGHSLTAQVLERVLPSRIRLRWAVRAGWIYAGSLAASIVAISGWSSWPAAQAWMTAVSADVSQHVVRTIVQTLHAFGFALLRIADGWGLLALAGERLGPLARALSALLSHPPIELALWGAAISSLCVLIWLHSREKPTGNGIPHAGLLGL